MAEPFLGEIKIWGVYYAPKNWAFCEGQLLPITEYQALYSLMGTTYGGDGRVTFGVPDTRGRIMVGAGQAIGDPMSFLSGHMGGFEGVALQSDQIPKHSHQMSANSAEANTQSPDQSVLAANSTTALYAKASQTNLVEMEDPTTMVGGDATHMNIQPSTVLNFCIALVGNYPSRN